MDPEDLYVLQTYCVTIERKFDNVIRGFFSFRNVVMLIWAA